MTTRGRTQQAEGGGGGREGVGCNRAWVPGLGASMYLGTQVPRYLATSPGCMHCAGAVLCHSLILRLPLPSLDFGFANSNFGPHSDIPDLAFPVLACLSLSAVLPSFPALCHPVFFETLFAPFAYRGAL